MRLSAIYLLDFPDTEQAADTCRLYRPPTSKTTGSVTQESAPLFPSHPTCQTYIIYTLAASDDQCDTSAPLCIVAMVVALLYIQSAMENM